MMGTYIIGVVGSEATSFTITVLYEEKKIVDIYSGLPFDVSLNAWDYIYYHYHHYENKEFSINF